MFSRYFLVIFFFLLTPPLYAKPKGLASSLPKGTRILSKKNIEIDKVSPREMFLTYQYSVGGETREVLGLYKAGCGLFWQSETALGTIVAPSWELRDVTGDGVNEVLIYQSVHAGQEFLVFVYSVKGCTIKEIVSDYSYPAVPPVIHHNAGKTTLTFVSVGRDGCQAGGEDDEGFVRTYLYKDTKFVLVEDRPYRQVYPLFTASLSGGKQAKEAAKQLLDSAKVYDHIAVDLTGDGTNEVVFLYDKGGVGALLIVSEKQQGEFFTLFEAVLGQGPLSLDGPVRAISIADLTGDGISELIFDSDAEMGCQLETWVMRFSEKTSELLLKVRRPLREKVSFEKSTLSYRELSHGVPLLWQWETPGFTNQSKEIFAPIRIPF